MDIFPFPLKDAQSVHLHDQRIVISKSINDHGVDSFWAAQGIPEYVLSSDLVRYLGFSPAKPLKEANAAIGIHRAYAPAMDESLFTLERLEVAVLTDRMIHIKMTMSCDDNEPWVDEWTYSGAFTIVWKPEPIAT